jgi:hypothetical protein
MTSVTIGHDIANSLYLSILASTNPHHGSRNRQILMNIAECQWRFGSIPLRNRSKLQIRRRPNFVRPLNSSTLMHATEFITT